jgi:hypothetical protein
MGIMHISYGTIVCIGLLGVFVFVFFQIIDFVSLAMGSFDDCMMILHFFCFFFKGKINK